MTASPPTDPVLPLPLDDPELARSDLDLHQLITHWAPRASLAPMTAEAMRGADVRTQRLGTPGERLMEQAGCAVAAVVRATLRTSGRPHGAVVLVLCGPGNNGGDGLVAARLLAEAGVRTAAVLVSADETPGTRDAAANWLRLDGVDGAERIHVPTAHDVAMLHNGLPRAGLIVDALLGTGVRGLLREPIRTAVDLIARARTHGVPVVAVDTPTALDLTSGEPSDPVVRADVTVTFHRPKQGLRMRAGRALAGHVLVAPIGIPPEADSGVSRPGERVSDRRVLLLLAACVLVVLGADVLSAIVPGLDTLLTGAPVLVIVLVVGTLGVLVWSVARARRD